MAREKLLCGVMGIALKLFPLQPVIRNPIQTGSNWLRLKSTCVVVGEVKRWLHSQYPSFREETRRLSVCLSLFLSSHPQARHHSSACSQPDSSSLIQSYIFLRVEKYVFSSQPINQNSPNFIHVD